MSLIKIFNQQIQIEPDWKKKPKKEPVFKIKPSMLGSPCMRKNYYSAAGVLEDYAFDLKGKKRMALGDSVHEMLSGVFKKAGVLIDYINPDGTPHKKHGFGEVVTEFPLSSLELFVKSAYIDAVMIIDGKVWICEYKSINLRGFNELMDPKNDHLIQAVTYFYIFNQHLKDGKFNHIKELAGVEKAEGVRWLYVNKDDTDFKEYVMTDATFVFRQIVEKILAIKQHYDSKTLPGKTKDWCTSCNWRDKCSKNFNIS